MAFLKELHKNNNFILLKKYEGEDIKADNDVQLEELNMIKRFRKYQV